jgi:hypothetical protein
VAPRVELHGRHCTCRGGAWVLLEGVERSPCSAGSSAAERAVVELAEWRQLGKPANLESFQEAQGRADSGDRRQFRRFEVSLPVRIERLTTWRDPSGQAEETTAEVLATGGALVRSRMAVDKGDTLRFRLRDYETRAEVTYVSTPTGVELPRLGLKFLDAPLPESLIPEDARPLP